MHIIFSKWKYVLSISKYDYMVPMSFVSYIIRCLRENVSCYGMVINFLASLQCARSLWKTFFNCMLIQYAYNSIISFKVEMLHFIIKNCLPTGPAAWGKDINTP